MQLCQQQGFQQSNFGNIGQANQSKNLYWVESKIKPPNVLGQFKSKLGSIQNQTLFITNKPCPDSVQTLIWVELEIGPIKIEIQLRTIIQPDKSHPNPVRPNPSSSTHCSRAILQATGPEAHAFINELSHSHLNAVHYQIHIGERWQLMSTQVHEFIEVIKKQIPQSPRC